MRYSIESSKFDTCLEPSDWRYAAAIVGLLKFFKTLDDLEYEVTDECLKFHSGDINDVNYLKFVELYYKYDLQHKQLESLMNQTEWTETEIKMANELLKGNSIMKKVFSKIKFDGTNQSVILELIDENRMDLIRETFRNKSNMYANFANTGQLFEDKKSCCRLLGYYVDNGRKSKSISYNFDVNTFVSQDDKVFDFIPFAFVGGREVFFINDNYSVKCLYNTNIQFENKVRIDCEQSENKIQEGRKILFKSIQESAEFIDYDVEVIVKAREKDFFQTMYIRQESIRILRNLQTYEPFCRSLKINENYYLNVQEKVTDCILNLVRTDELIEICLKRKLEYMVSLLIKLNYLICGGGESLKQSMKVAYACAKEVVKKLPENKRESYRQKLISSIVFKDYDRYCQVLLQLSNYSDVSFDFAFDLFEDFEKNKDVAYTFINALTKKKDNETANG